MHLYHVDSFTSVPFKGNPAAVCITDEPLGDALMQKIAFEMNLSESAFLVQRESGFLLRWFTPKVEVDLCGHATLASAHVLWETGRVKPHAEIEFHTKSGVLTALESGGWIELNFPTERLENSRPPEGLMKALAAEPLYVGRTRFDYFIELASEEGVRNMKPDFDLLMEVPCRGVIVTARAGRSSAQGVKYDFVSRFFAPQVGIREDPVTGSAHCSLAPFWKEKLGKSALIAYQASERGGLLKVRAEGERTYIGGQAVTILEGRLVHIS